MHRWSAVIVCLSLACTPSDDGGDDPAAKSGDTGTGGTTDDGGDDGTTDDPEPQPVDEYYYAESVIDVDNGSFVFEETYWVHRSVVPADATITEVFVAEADGTETTTVLTVSADATSFELEINDGEYTGAGNLYGDAWAWTHWDSISMASDGSSVHSEDARTDTGIVAHKVGFGTDGLQEWELDEVLTEVSEADWQAGLDALGR